MIVTGIVRQKKHPDRYSLHIDGSFTVGVSAAVLARTGIRPGDTVSENTLQALRSEEELDAARIAAMRYAGRRRRTEQEIRTKLLTRGIHPQAVEAAVASLRTAGLLDDRAFIRAFIHDAQLHRPSGGRLIARRLRRKGIPDGILREEIEGSLGPEQEAPLAKRCAERYLGTLDRRATNRRGHTPPEREALLRRYLTGRGFCGYAIDEAVKSVLPGRRGGE